MGDGGAVPHIRSAELAFPRTIDTLLAPIGDGGICHPASPETIDITGFFEKFCIAIRTKVRRCNASPHSFFSILMEKPLAVLRAIVYTLSVSVLREWRNWQTR